MVVLCEVQDPGNAGTVIRTADAAGADAVVLTAGSVEPGTASAFARRREASSTCRSSTGLSVDGLFSPLRALGCRVLATSGTAQRTLDHVLATGELIGPTAWIFGNEAHGLSPELLAAADLQVRVPIVGRAESLNLAGAATVCLYASAWAKAQRRDPGPRRTRCTGRRGDDRNRVAPLGDPCDDLGPLGPAPVAVLALEDLPDAVLLVDVDGDVLAANSLAVRLCAIDGAPVGQPRTEVLPLRDARGNDWWACTAARPPAARRHPRPGAAADLRRAHVAGVGALRPRRRAVRLHRARPSADTAARERQERSAADLVSTVAHEIRSPLTSVKGFTATLLAKWDRFTDEQKQIMLQTVNADADRVTRLISELLDVSRIDSGRLELHQQVVDVGERVRRAFDGHIAAGERRTASSCSSPARRRRCGSTRTSSTRSSATWSRTRCGTATARSP